MSELLASLREAMKDGYWEAGVHHCPPPRNRRDNPLRHAAFIRLAGRFSTEAEALSSANAAISSGWASNIIVHKPSASPSALFCLSRDSINKVGQIVFSPTPNTTLDEQERGA